MAPASAELVEPVLHRSFEEAHARYAQAAGGSSCGPGQGNRVGWAWQGCSAPPSQCSGGLLCHSQVGSTHRRPRPGSLYGFEWPHYAACPQTNQRLPLHPAEQAIPALPLLSRRPLQQLLCRPRGPGLAPNMT